MNVRSGAVLPAAVNPEPLVGILGWRLRSRPGCARYPRLSIAGDVHCRVEAQDVTSFRFAPDRKAGNDGGAAAGGQLREVELAQAGLPKKGTKTPLSGAVF